MSISAPGTTTRFGDWLRRLDPHGVWQSRLFNLTVAIIVGVILGQLLYKPNPRIIKAAAGFGVLYAAWKFPIPVSLSVFLVMFPFPFAISYGSSNTIFVFIITAMWLAQIVLRTERPVGRTPLDLHISVLLSIYLLSFGNVPNSFGLVKGLINFSTILASIFVYYLIVHSVRSEKTLRRIVGIVTLMAILNFCVAGYELVFPGRPLVKGWILSTTFYDPSIVTGLRVGGGFEDFELFAEFCAICLPLTLFHLMQAKGLRNRILSAGLVFFNFFCLMATVTRGATISGAIGLLYLLYRVRKSMSLTTFMLTVTTALSLVFFMEFFLTTYTVSGSVISRLLNSKMVNGMPDSRTFWPDIFKRCFEHVWIGHGPYYEFGEYGREKLRKFFWPHNGYLYYFHTVGLFGLTTFVAILVTAYRVTSARMASSLSTTNYTAGLMLALNTMIVTFGFDQMKIEYLRSPTYQFWPWIILGLIAATHNVMKSQNAATDIPKSAQDSVAAPDEKMRGSRRWSSPKLLRGSVTPWSAPSEGGR